MCATEVQVHKHGSMQWAEQFRIALLVSVLVSVLVSGILYLLGEMREFQWNIDST